MTPREALAKIAKDLSAAFGDGLAARIMSSARSAVQAPDRDLGRLQYVEVVRALCKDERVIGMLGELTVREKRSLWEQLVN
jgi:hypothetical protein